MHMFAAVLLLAAAASAANLNVVPLGDAGSTSTVVHNNGAGGGYSYSTVQKSLGGLTYPQPLLNQQHLKSVAPALYPHGLVYPQAAVGTPLHPGLVYANGLGGVVPQQYQQYQQYQPLQYYGLQKQ